MQNESPKSRNTIPERSPLFGVPEGYDSVFLAAEARKRRGVVLHIAADDNRFEEIYESLHFFAPDVEVLRFPAWDCLPYDRVSPTSEVMGQRLQTLTRLLSLPAGTPCVVLTTVGAAMQRVPPRDTLSGASFSVRKGGTLDQKKLLSFLAANGYHRTETVREAGEFALRGGLVDIFPSGAAEPLRLDCFGDDVEHIRAFDALSQRTTEDRTGLDLYPVSEVLLNDDAIQLFRGRYRETFGAVREEDALYESASAGRKHAGMEHWLPFFYGQLDTLFDYMPDAAVMVDYQAEQARDGRLQQVDDLYQARLSIMQADDKAKGKDAKNQGLVYRPVPIEQLYLPNAEWHKRLAAHVVQDLVPFAPTPGQSDAGGRKGRDFADVRAQNGAGLYDEIKTYLESLLRAQRQVIIAAYSEGSKERLKLILQQHGMTGLKDIAPQAVATGHYKPVREVGMAVLGLGKGFECKGLSVLTEQDLLGDRLARVTRKKKKSDAFVFEISQLHE
ncbi:MAG TPA: transcription-repair coupling factor, partial [Rhodospirillaceae bacterium]|nr:transcription-repair coupling factor [Rhodospirillaceae bacterium]